MNKSLKRRSNRRTRRFSKRGGTLSASARSFTPLRATAPNFEPNTQLTPDRAATRIQIN